ncbi:MAG: Flp family type IVb pilin [Jatrophihabitans sp.]|nr:MAG: Flp family type IVb pilin [Jatrophihabitans sp.]
MARPAWVRDRIRAASAGSAAAAGERRDRGATATEYALLVGFIAVVIALAIAFFGTSLSEYIQHIANGLSAAL